MNGAGNGGLPGLDDVQARMRGIAAAVEGVVLGAGRAVHLTTLALFARGHVLYQGLPGQGKTLLATCFARAIGGVSERFQGSPDFLFSEALISAFPDEDGELRYHAGRLVRHGERLGIVLLDEINRFLPNTQAGFLEVMQERRVTTATRTYPLPHFLGIATRNPLETAETYPLPEALLDRFLMLVRVGYPEPEAERRVITDPRYRRPEDAVAAIEPVVRLADLDGYAAAIRQRVAIRDAAADYIHRLGLATRRPSVYGVELDGLEDVDGGIVAGASTRAITHLAAAAQVAAAWEGRDFVAPEDVQGVVFEVLEHRIFVKPVVLGGRPEFVRELLERIVARVPAP